MNFALVWCVCGEGRAAALGSIGIGRWGKTERADTQASMTGAGGKGVIFCTKLVWCAVRVLGTLRLGRLPDIARQYRAVRMVRQKGGGPIRTHLGGAGVGIYGNPRAQIKRRLVDTFSAAGYVN